MRKVHYIESTIISEAQTIAAYATALNKAIEPDVYVVATLKQGRQGEKGWVHGTREDYQHTVDKFVHAVSAQLYRQAYRRHKLLVPHLITLEGVGKMKDIAPTRRNIFRRDMRAHINMCIKRPKHVSYDLFAEQIKQNWLKLDWALPDIYIEKRTGDCIAYSLKEGTDSILSVASLIDRRANERSF